MTDQIEFLVVQFKTAANIVGMDIYETYNPSGLVRISALPEDCEELYLISIPQMQKTGLQSLPYLGPGWITVWQGTPEILPPEARINMIKFTNSIPIKARTFRLDIDSRPIQHLLARLDPQTRC